MSYWDINQFLAEEEKVEFSITQDAHLLDFLDNTKEGTIPEGTTITSNIWLVNTLSDYLDSQDTQVKPHVPEDYLWKQLDRYYSFQRSEREQFRTKADMPYFYEIYEAMKKVMAHQQRKISGDKLSEILEERAKLIISRACGIFEQTKADSVTNNYTKFELALYKLTRNKSLEYHKWKTA